MTEALRDPSSFRDPSGFIFREPDGTVLRQVNRSYEDDYMQLINNGLYDELVKDGLLVEHEEVSLSRSMTNDACFVLQPRNIDFISYPYEWCYSALKDAALLTLDIQRRAMQHGMSLKDATSYNVQFDGTIPVFIDSLSFERLDVDQPWQGYSQFCRHFLAPLALMSQRDVCLNRLLAIYLDGVPLDLASKLLPWRTRLRPGLLFHLHLHARMLRAYSNTATLRGKKNYQKRKVTGSGLSTVLDHLRKTIVSLSVKTSGTEWVDYYDNTSYSELGFSQKRSCVEMFLKYVKPKTIWDLGANTGEFSRIATEQGAMVYAFDIDPLCVEVNYQSCRREKRRILPLLLDLANPSPAIGWAHTERLSLAERGPVDTVMALALIHHLAITNNVPFEHVSQFFAQLCKHLIIEFVPKNDPQVKRLLVSRDDIFSEYDQAAFEATFQKRFEIIENQPIGEDGRVLYLMRTLNSPSA